MDTKWNNTNDNNGQLPAEPVKSAALTVRTSPGRGKSLRAIAGFLAFFLGLSLMLGSAGQIAGRLAWQRDYTGWQLGDWQQTPAFRDRMADYLAVMLNLGAGNGLGNYYTSYDYMGYDYYDYGFDEAPATVEEGIATFMWGDKPLVEAESRDPSPYYVGLVPQEQPDGASEPAKPNPDADKAFRADKNVLYYVNNWGRNFTYTNYDGSYKDLTMDNRLPEGYNFLLRFRDGKVTILHNGQELDVYGDGIYREGSGQWYVPGYENFAAGEDAEKVLVCLAVRAEPIQYINRASGSYSNLSGSLYYLCKGMEQSRAFYRTRLIVLGIGAALMVLYVFLRKDKARADRAIAGLTAHVWTEVRFLLTVACLIWLAMFGSSVAGWISELGWVLREVTYADSAYATTYIVEMGSQYAARMLENTPPLLALFWLLYLIINDHRYTDKDRRRSLGALIQGRGLKLPIQKRMSRRAGLALLGALIVTLVGDYLIIVLMLAFRGPLWFAALLIGAYLVGVVLMVVALLGKNHRRTWKDVGALVDQIRAVHDGNLTDSLDLPKSADLREAAENLNDIQSGMGAALAEQTRSERMKVELISNVSHDLKTPLTSILSYADLLRQEEDLPEHVRDYIRIIDEKARRLSAMVGDVFDVSKAAAGQLPVRSERLDLAKLLRQTLADLDGPIQHSGLAFRVDLPDAPVFIVADGDRLYRVFQNLIQNALKYALEGTRVYLTLTTDAARAEASLRNTSREELPAGVDFTARFVRGDASRTDGGSGLGLSIASSFIEACGGQFRVETLADLFTAIVSFPLAEEEADQSTT